ncbi:MAG: hypothetical protein H7263_14205 [Candidatus Sericytochromatia bacterium]|nr:hypothetical protein [Candidatus Sericytochromatia bacterium]
MSKIEVLSDDLNKFVEKYFIEIDFAGVQLISDEEIIGTLSEIEKTLVKIIEKKYEDNDPSLWFNREMCLRSLVVLLHTDHFSEVLEFTNHLDRANTLYARVVDSFSKKILEDPDIVKAIQENRLEEEIEKRFPKEILNSNKRTSNFIELVDDKSLNSIPEDYEHVPDKF